MLKTLTIKNIALIDSVEIKFENGLNVLSGETGSGKSVIIESLNFVLGAKADKTLIRSGEVECSVKAEFDIEKNDSVKQLLTEFDIENEGSIIILRKFNIDGKTSVRINGESVTISMLKKLTALLVDIHGQSEHFHLLKSQNQLALIDKFGGETIAKIKEELCVDYTEYKQIIKYIDELGGDESQRLMRIDILNYQINEIEQCDLKENEENELKEIKLKLDHQEKIASALSIVKNCIKEEGGASDILSNAVKSIASLAHLCEEFSELYDRLSNAFSELDDIGDTASSILDDFDFSEYNADQIENRLESIKNLKKKYGADFYQIQLYLQNAKNERDKLENFNQHAEKLLSDRQEIEAKIYNKYCALSDLRRKFATKFSSNVLTELKELGMPKANFLVQFNELIEKNNCKFDSANGIDAPEFMFSANLGEPLKTLSSVISGGEMSRFMLAIKTQTAKYNDISTFIFDEIDAGISGLIAKVVSEKFAKISKDVQIIAISHLPQISAMADNNLLIEKKEVDNKTVTSVTKLNHEQKINEITRLVGGTTDSLSAKSHACELIVAANSYKNSI